MSYNREAAVAYAHKWAFSRNPRYLDFHGIGGDCTNFISQCLHAGGAPMNYTKTFGWYYNSQSDRAPAWTGVQYLYNFLMKQKKPGPYAEEVPLWELLPGDVIQLSFTQGVFSHTLLVVETGPIPSPDNLLVATHSLDSDHRPLATYQTVAQRYLRIRVL